VRSETTKQSRVYDVRLPRLRAETQHSGVQARSRWSFTLDDVHSLIKLDLTEVSNSLKMKGIGRINQKSRELLIEKGTVCVSYFIQTV